MVTIHKPLVSAGYELCQPLEPEQFAEIRRLIDGTPRSATWTPVEMQTISEEADGERLLASDSPWLGGHCLVFSQYAVAQLGALLERSGELLPLACERRALFAFNPPVVAALDLDRCIVQRFRSGQIMSIERHAFDLSALGDIDLFKVPDLRVSPTYVTSRFVTAWQAAGLVGLDFPIVSGNE
jgi:hypothetical protein